MVLKPTEVVPSTVQLLNVPDVGVPRTGVTKAGLVANTSAPVPVSSVTAAARFADDGVPRNVATPVPNEVIPVPPLATAKVPASVMVPDVVMGEPDTVRPVVPPERATEVTVPVDAAAKDKTPEPFVEITCPAVPSAVG